MAAKTIKELADSLGVSKTAVRKKMDDEFRKQYVETGADGTLRISETGCAVLETCFRKPAETIAETTANTANQLPQTEPETTANQGFQLVIETLRAQLEVKDAQIAALNDRLAEAAATITETTRALTETQKSLQAAQALHAGTMQQQLLAEGETVTVQPAQEVKVQPEQTTRKPPEQKKKQEKPAVKKKEGLFARFLGRNRR